MIEVTIRLRFIRECLGSAKRRTQQDQIIFKLPRAPNGRVMFLPSWWARLLTYAANVNNTSHALVKRIDWNPIIDGSPCPDWRRVLTKACDDRQGRTRYAVHEAFPPGAVIGVNAVIPDGMHIDDLHRLLTTAGTYKGISPFVDEDEQYGLFDVVSVKSARRKNRRRRRNKKHQANPGEAGEAIVGSNRHATVDSSARHAD